MCLDRERGWCALGMVLKASERFEALGGASTPKRLKSVAKRRFMVITKAGGERNRPEYAHMRERNETRRKEEEQCLVSLLGEGCARWRRSPEAWPERRR